MQNLGGFALIRTDKTRHLSILSSTVKLEARHHHSHCTGAVYRQIGGNGDVDQVIFVVMKLSSSLRVLTILVGRSRSHSKPLTWRSFCTRISPTSSAVWLSKLSEGKKISLDRCFTEQDVISFCRLCKLGNTIHLDVHEAQHRGLSDRKVPEFLYAGLFPAIVGTHFPGSIYISQSLEFRSPVLVGEYLHAEVKTLHLRSFRDKYRVEFATTCWKKQGNVLALEGNAIALLPYTELHKQ